MKSTIVPLRMHELREASYDMMAMLSARDLPRFGHEVCCRGCRLSCWGSQQAVALSLSEAVKRLGWRVYGWEQAIDLRGHTLRDLAFGAGPQSFAAAHMLERDGRVLRRCAVTPRMRSGSRVNRHRGNIPEIRNSRRARGCGRKCSLPEDTSAISWHI